MLNKSWGLCVFEDIMGLTLSSQFHSPAQSSFSIEELDGVFPFVFVSGFRDLKPELLAHHTALNALGECDRCVPLNNTHMHKSRLIRRVVIEAIHVVVCFRVLIVHCIFILLGTFSFTRHIFYVQDSLTCDARWRAARRCNSWRKCKVWFPLQCSESSAESRSLLDNRISVVSLCQLCHNDNFLLRTMKMHSLPITLKTWFIKSLKPKKKKEKKKRSWTTTTTFYKRTSRLFLVIFEETRRKDATTLQ